MIRRHHISRLMCGAAIAVTTSSIAASSLAQPASPASGAQSPPAGGQAADPHRSAIAARGVAESAR